MKFRVVDWTGTEMDFGTFKTFDDAWGFLMVKFPDDENLQEYEVEEIRP